MTRSAGSFVGPFEVVGLLGAGGIGEVYRAKDRRLKREVAVKVLPADVNRNPEWARRFEEWAQEVEIYAYFNNDWEVFAPRNARWLKKRLGV